MGLIQDAIRKWKQNKEEKKRMERIGHWEDQIAAKKISHYERELMAHNEDKRQERIKSAVKRIRLQKKREIWSGRKWNPVYAHNMFKDEKNLFAKQPSVFFKKDKSKTPNVFFKK